MHELSIVMSIIDIAKQQADRACAAVIDEIELDIGTMSGIEMDSFEFAWKQAVRGSVLEGAARKINTIEAKARCLDCDAVFSIHHYFDPCPVCGEHLLDILSGKELKVKSLVVS
ncbi:MAG: hydrogenase maturation nickel metallochaperone HypA [Sediminibacterium sp.]|nr:hydrogenase maturation nickel metallochaperone HypA [Sediminibacterium sp.]